MALVKRSALAAKGGRKSVPETVAKEIGAVAPPVAKSRTPRAHGRQTAAEGLAAATQQLASGVTEAAAAAEELRRALEQISSAAEEAAGASHESLASVTRLAELFLQARERAEFNRARTEALQALMTETRSQVDGFIAAVEASAARQLASVEAIGSLEAQAARIGEITLTVADMADQTNLLALNAAIEAARAGERGLGFAVVADEVRSLAETAERRSGEVRTAADAVGAEVRTVADRVRSAADVANEEAKAGRAVTDVLSRIRTEMAAVSEASQSILLAAVEAEAAAREAQRGAEGVSSAAEEQSAAAAQAQRSVQLQAGSLTESDRTAAALAERAEQLQTGAGAQHATEMASAAEELSAVVQQLAGSATEILVAVDQISRGAQSQAAATQESAAALNQIERAATRARALANASLERIESVDSFLSEAAQAVAKLTKGLDAGLTTTRGTVSLIGDLEESARRIDKTVDAIALIAMQTTMLAVSGSVEAARAGEAGRGFATVSGDIRALARESGENVDRVKDVVRAVQAQIAAVRRDLEQILLIVEGEAAKNRVIADRLERSGDDVAGLRRAAQDICGGAENVLKLVAEISAGTQQIASAAEEAAQAGAESAAAARQQARSAEDLAAAVEEIAQLADNLGSTGG